MAKTKRKFSDDWRKKLSLAGKGHSVSKEARLKMSNSRKGKCFRKEYKHSEETKNKISKAHKGKHHTEETRVKISMNSKGKVISEETKRKIRLSTFEYAKKVADIICPRIGHNEKQILDKLEKELKYKIVRKFEVEGYFVDGYIPELKVAIEVDEIPKIQKRDIERQKIIESKLNCKFIRINDFD